MNRRILITTNKTIFTGDECPIELPTFGGSMYAAYLLGTDYWTGSSFTTVKDGSGRGRDIVINGSISAKYIEGPTNYAVTPFTADQLCAANSSCTIMSVSNVPPNQSGHYLGDYSSSATRYISLFGSSTFAVDGQSKNGGTTVTARDPDSDDLRSGFEFVALTTSPSGGSIWRSKTGAGLRKAGTTATTLPAVGGELAIQIGKPINGAGASNQTAFAAFFDRALTDDEMRALFPKVVALLAGGGITVAQ